MDHGLRAEELFKQGYNCSQSVFIAFCDLMKLDESFAARISCSFGGGISRLREVGGAVTGMAMVLGVLYGYDSPTDDRAKGAHYMRVQELAHRFQNKTGSILCRELLDNPSTNPIPAPRTAQYYQERPCAGYVKLAGQLLDEYIREHPLEHTS